MASGQKPAKACHDFNNDFTLFTEVPVLFNIDFTLFSALPVLFNMYTDKDSNLISDLKNQIWRRKC